MRKEQLLIHKSRNCSSPSVIAFRPLLVIMFARNDKVVTLGHLAARASITKSGFDFDALLSFKVSKFGDTLKRPINPVFLV